MQQPWAMTEQALEALVELVRVKAESLPELQAAFPQQQQTRPMAGAVAVIPVRGTIAHHAASDFFSLFFGGTSSDAILASLREALADDAIASVVLDIDSPGGTTYGMAEMAAAVRAMRGKKPIIAVANAVAASKAFALACQADEFYVTPSGLVGSIGVYALHMDVSRAMEAEGITPTFISAGKHKVEGNEFEPLGNETLAFLQSVINESYDQFVADVAAGRGVPESTVRSGYGEGRAVTAKQAKKLGMVDGIATLDQAIARASALSSTRTMSGQQAAAADLSETEPQAADEGARRLRLLCWQEQQALAGTVKGGPSGY